MAAARKRGARGIALTVGAVLIALTGWLVFGNLRGGARADITTRLSLSDALGTGDPAGYARALEPRPFVFPADHGPHPAFRTEWWYLTGNLDAADGRRFGYQLTIFRSALAPDSVARASAWATTQAYMAHFALTDVDGRVFHAFDRFARGAAGLAGAGASPFRVWLEDWTMQTEPSAAADADAVRADPAAIFPLRVVAREGDVAIDLRLDAGKPIVLHGDAGLSRKGEEPGNASFYFSFTRLPTNGTMRVNGEAVAVSGTSWYDREWSTSQLAEGVTGWDWFAVQLDDGTDVMLFQLRRADGSAALRGGTLVDGAGVSRALAEDEVVLRVADTWSSSIDGTSYPSRWAVQLPEVALELDIVPLLADQELDLAVRYWEGAVAVTGTRDGLPVRGRGYVELTGYAGAATGPIR